MTLWWTFSAEWLCWVSSTCICVWFSWAWVNTTVLTFLETTLLTLQHLTSKVLKNVPLHQALYIMESPHHYSCTSS